MRAWCLLAALVVGVGAAPARAGECTTAVVKGSPELGSLDAQVRLRFIRERLRDEARRARIWSWSWAGVYTGLTAGQLAITPAQARSSRPDMYVGAGASFLGLAVIGVMPLQVMGDQKWLERRLAKAPPGTHECVLLAEAEQLLVRDAKNEAFGVSTLVHLGNLIVNLGVFAAIGFGFGHWPSGALSFAAGVAVGEVMIYTQPLGAVEDLRRYRDGQLTPAPPAPRVGLTVAPFAPAGERGVGRGAVLALTF
jgi:hypothetical protein